MRNLEECKAEIFRRSEKRIKERQKKRKRVVTASISLIFCAVIGGFAVLPTVFGADRPEIYDESRAESDISRGLSGAECRYTATEISVNGEEGRRIESMSETAEIYAVIAEAFDTAVERARELDEQRTSNSKNPAVDANFNLSANDDLAVSDDNAYLEVSSAEMAVQAVSYEITLIAPDGSRASYSLIGNVLFDRTANRKCVLMTEQLAELSSMLGINEK